MAPKNTKSMGFLRSSLRTADFSPRSSPKRPSAAISRQETSTVRRSLSSAILIVLIVRVFLEFYMKKFISGFPWTFHQLGGGRIDLRPHTKRAANHFPVNSWPNCQLQVKIGNRQYCYSFIDTIMAMSKCQYLVSSRVRANVMVTKI